MIEEISFILDSAQKAQKIYNSFSQEQVDDVCLAIGSIVFNEEENKKLSKMAVESTGLGNVKDKMIKNYRKTLGLLRDLKGTPSLGVVKSNEEEGILEIFHPVGVVAGLTPSTNPVATPINKTINALKGRNAIILAPSPKGAKVTDYLVKLMHEKLKKVGVPQNLVQTMPSPPSKEATEYLIKNVDLVVVTGSQNNVRKAYSSGTPTIGVGTGNVVVIVDETAELKSAAEKITLSKCFDNSTSCSSENHLVIVNEIYDLALTELKKAGAYQVNDSLKEKLKNYLWKNGKLDHNVLAKDFKTMADSLGITDYQDKKYFIVEEENIGKEFNFSGEKMSLVLTVYRANNFLEAKEISKNILNFQGRGHSIGIHTKFKERAVELGLELPTCRVIVNQAHCFANGGNFNNALPFSLSMGCGTWGKNSFSDNMNYKHFLNTTRVVMETTPHEPKLNDLYDTYWKKYGKN